MLGNFTTVDQEVLVVLNVGTSTQMHMYFCAHLERKSLRVYCDIVFWQQWRRMKQYIRLSYCSWAMFRRRKKAGRFFAKPGIPKLYFFAGITKKRGS